MGRPRKTAAELEEEQFQEAVRESLREQQRMGEWQGHLQELECMGFTDRSKNLALLTQTDGDLAAVVEHLLV